MEWEGRGWKQIEQENSVTIIGNRASFVKVEPYFWACLFSRMWDSKYLVSIFPGRQCDHQCHNGNPDEEHMQLLSLNKISQFPLRSGTMGPLPGRWLSSYFPRAIIKAQPLPPTTLIHFTALCSSSFSSPHPSPSRAEAWHKWNLILSSPNLQLFSFLFLVFWSTLAAVLHTEPSVRKRGPPLFIIDFVGWLIGSFC